MNLQQELSTTAKKTILGVVLAGITIIAIALNIPSPSPKLRFVDPAGDTILSDTNEAIIRGVVSPERGEVFVNHTKVLTDHNGTFSYKVQLNEGANAISVSAEHEGKSIAKELHITVELSAAEKERRIVAEKEKQRQEDERLKAILEKQKAKDAAYAKTPEGKLCLAHLKWKTEDCTRLIKQEVWIGMGTDMIIYLNGNHPDVLNKANYGSGDQWQVCWFSKTPSCFYDKDNDGYVDSYN